MTLRSEPRIARSLGRGIHLLAYPPPYRSWLTLSNDPDCTTWERWRELHEVIWTELGLPFADSFFLFTYNDAIPHQVSVAEHPEILTAHAHDTMHTWGDYTMSRQRLFNRDEARAGLALLSDSGIMPRIWTDHSNFTGNLLHRGQYGALASIKDASGHSYENFVYSLDLIRQAGVRYVWDGSHYTRVLGQDRKISRQEWYAAAHGNGLKSKMIAAADVIAGTVLRRLQSQLATYTADINSAYYPHTFPDQQTFYLLRRYVHWELADIDGFGEVMAPATIDRLIENQGTCVAYTHLGKQRANRPACATHVPPATRQALEHVARRHGEGSLMLSSTSHLLDYLVLRDHAELDGERLDFRADGVRYIELRPADLAGMEFGIKVFGTKANAGKTPTVTCSGQQIEHRWTQTDRDFLTLSFPEPVPDPAVSRGGEKI